MTFAPYLDGITQFNVGDSVLVSNATGSVSWSKIDGIATEVTGVLGLVGPISLTQLVAGGLAPTLSPALTGTPTAPTPATADSSTTLATTAYVNAQSYLTGNQNISFTGDATGTGTTSVALTLANVMGSPGTYTKVTANAKGLITAATNLTTADVTAALGGNAAVTVNQIDASGGIVGRGSYGQVAYGGATQGLILKGNSVAGASIRLASDNVIGTINATNSIPIAMNTAGRIVGHWQVKNTSNNDVLCGDFSITVSRGTGAPVLGTVVAGNGFTVFDYTGSTLTTAAPVPTVAIDSTNNCLNITFPGYGGLNCDVRIIVDEEVLY